jgi:hypothetical protein
MNYESDKYRIATYNVQSVRETLAPLKYLQSCGTVLNAGIQPFSGPPSPAPPTFNNVGIIYFQGQPQNFVGWYGLYLPSTDLAENAVTWGPGIMYNLRFTSVINPNLWFQADFGFVADYGYYKYWVIQGASKQQNGLGSMEIASAFGPQTTIQWGPFIGNPENGYLINQTPIPYNFDNYTYVVEQTGTYVISAHVFLAAFGTFNIPCGIAFYINNTQILWSTASQGNDFVSLDVNFNGSLNLNDEIQIRYICDNNTAWANLYSIYPTTNTFQVTLINKEN